METEEVKAVEVPEPITLKDPKKVEAGKRLAAISKEAKEKKMRAKIEAEMDAEAERKKIRIPVPLLIGVPVVGGYLIYKYFVAGKSVDVVVPDPGLSKKKSPLPSPPMKKTTPPRSPSPPPPKKFESFD